MFEFIETLPWPLGSSLVVLIFITFSTIGILFCRSMIDRKGLKAHHDVAAVVFTNLGVLYSVLLGFTVVNVQQRYDQTENTTKIEASYLAQLFADSEVFADSKNEIQQAIKLYAQSVIDDEWPTMGIKGAKSLKTKQRLKDLWQAYYSLNPTSNKEIVWYTKSIDQLNKLMEARIARIVGSQDSLSDEMWSLLIIGGILIVSFLGFFGLENAWIHLLLGATLAATTAFLLYLIYSLDTAFTGKTSIPPDAMAQFLGTFQ